MSVATIFIVIVAISLVTVMCLYFKKRSVSSFHAADKVESPKQNVLNAESLKQEPLIEVEDSSMDELLKESMVMKEKKIKTPAKKEPVKKVAVKKAPVKKEKNESVKKEPVKKTAVKKKSVKQVSPVQEPVKQEAPKPTVKLTDKQAKQQLKDEIIASYMSVHAAGSKSGIRTLMSAGINRLTDDAEILEVLDEIERRVGKNVLGDDAYTSIYAYGFVKFFNKINPKMLIDHGVEGSIDLFKDSSD